MAAAWDPRYRPSLFTRLPPDVQIQIISHLPLGSLPSLARCSPAWLTAAESLIWRDVDLSHPALPSSVAQAALSGLRRSRGRVEHVESLAVPPCHCTGLLDVLTLFVHEDAKLEVLDLSPADKDWEDTENLSKELDKLHALLHHAPSIPPLQSLIVPLRQASPVSDLAAILPTLVLPCTSLTLILQPDFAPLSPMTRPLPPSTAQLPHLLSLEVVDLTNPHLPLLTSLVSLTPNLQDLYVRARNLEIDADRQLASMAPIRQHPKLKRVEWTGSGGADSQTMMGGEELFCGGGGFEGVETLVMDQRVVREEWTTLAAVTIPPLRSLRQLVIPCRRYDAFDSGGVGGSPASDEGEPPWDEVAAIEPRIINMLQQAPKLEQILFSHDGDVRDDPLQWSECGMSGILVRSFRSEETHGGKELEMFHCRRWDLEEERWEEMSWFEGEVVPLDTLAKVYALMGREMDSTISGRDMTMSGAAWNALRFPAGT